MTEDNEITIDRPYQLGKWLSCPFCKDKNAGIEEKPDGEILVECYSCGNSQIVTYANSQRD